MRSLINARRGVSATARVSQPFRRSPISKVAGGRSTLHRGIEMRRFASLEDGEAAPLVVRSGAVVCGVPPRMQRHAPGQTSLPWCSHCAHWTRSLQETARGSSGLAAKADTEPAVDWTATGLCFLFPAVRRVP
jgi:hypothetical protein